MNYEKLLKKVKKYVTAYYADNEKINLYYHNIDHTSDVVKHVREIGKHYGLREEEQFILSVAAWFHDIGYLTGAFNHEEKGAAMARAFLIEKLVPETVILQVEATIRATKMPQSPANQLESIICDADLYHLGTTDFNKQHKLLRKEMTYEQSGMLTELDLWKMDLAFMVAHHFHTDYCEALLASQKKRNIEGINQRINSISTDLELAEIKKLKQERPERGVDTLVRIVSNNNQRLSSLADNKAHILITVNSIILSAIISLVLRRLDAYPHLIVPTVILLTVSLSAMIFAILATRPSISIGMMLEAVPDREAPNLLFFGNFYKMDARDYADQMVGIMKDHELLYRMIINDIFNQGVVLSKKYRFLRFAYNIFMYGLVISVIAYLIASLISSGPQADLKH